MDANAHHMPMETLRMHYVQNHTGGDALRHPEPHLRHDGVVRFTTASGMFECLKAVPDETRKHRRVQK